VSAAAGPGPGPRVRRPVKFAGIVLGTCLLTLAYMDGARPAIPGVPHWLGLALGAVLAWLAAAALVAALAELLRRHHRTLAAHAARHGKRGTLAAARVAGRGGRSVTSRLTAWAGPRWAARVPVAGGVDRALPQDAADRREVIEAERRGGSREPLLPAGIDPRLNKQQVQRDIEGKRGECAACGNPFTPGDPMVIAPDGFRVHTSETTDPASGYYDPAGAPAPGVTAHSNGGTAVMTETESRPGPTAARANAPAVWKALAAATADADFEDDGALLEWMASEVAGIGSYAEALIAVYESTVDSIGLDPVAMSAVHDVADAAADCATAMAYARQKFAGHYAEVREAVSNGLLLPFDGRWIKGEGDA
jgi:hypothetical protein